MPASSGILPDMTYSKRHNKFLFPALAGAIYGSFCKAENEISNVVNYSTFNGGNPSAHDGVFLFPGG